MQRGKSGKWYRDWRKWTGTKLVLIHCEAWSSHSQTYQWKGSKKSIMVSFNVEKNTSFTEVEYPAIKWPGPLSQSPLQCCPVYTVAQTRTLEGANNTTILGSHNGDDADHSFGYAKPCSTGLKRTPENMASHPRRQQSDSQCPESHHKTYIHTYKYSLIHNYDCTNAYEQLWSCVCVPCTSDYWQLSQRDKFHQKLTVI